MSDEIMLDKEVFKALAGDTRIAVLKALLVRRKTQSELAKELSLSAPTIKDHLDILVKAGLVREMNDGHKWKYIELTVKGKSLLQPQDKRILVLLGTSLIGIAGAGMLAYTKFATTTTDMMMQSSSFAMEKTAMIATVPPAPMMDAAAGTIATDASARTAEAATQVLPFLPVPELAVLVLCLVVFGMAVGMWIKQTY